MKPEELDHLAHQIAYTTARSDIESFTKSVDVSTGGHRWYDLSTVIRDAYERDCVANAIFYLDGRELLLRHSEKPFYVRVLDVPVDGAVLSRLELVPLEHRRA
jgi:hypothetical protein